MSISRRHFIEAAAVSAVAAQAAEVDSKSGLPMRTLGQTGRKVTMLVFGSGSRFLMYKEDDDAVAALSKALDLGINYIDTAYGYGNGKSETRVGKLMPSRRKDVFLATKVNARGGDEAKRIIEGSLKRLQTDHVDLLHIHSLTTPEDLAEIEAPNGVLKVLHQMRDQKVARAIGITSHTDPLVLKTALERHDFDCTQMALNAARAGMVSGNPNMMPKEMGDHSFESLALPVAVRKKMGIIAMKVFAQEGLVGKASPEKLIRYSLSLPVTACVVGMPDPKFIEQNVAIVKAFKPLAKPEMERLATALSGEHKARLDRFFNDHVDA